MRQRNAFRNFVTGFRYEFATEPCVGGTYVEAQAPTPPTRMGAWPVAVAVADRGASARRGRLDQHRAMRRKSLITEGNGSTEYDRRRQGHPGGGGCTLSTGREVSRAGVGDVLPAL